LHNSYKGKDLGRLSLNVQNTLLYGFGVVCCVVYAIGLHIAHPAE
jgi:hypothetical protein